MNPVRSIESSLSFRPAWRLARLARIAAAAAFWPACGWTAPDAVPHVPAPVAKALAQAGLTSDSLAYVAYRLDAPARKLGWQDQRPMKPGSTMKVVTAIVALDVLGPNSHGGTDILAEEIPADGVLRTPLYLRGGADTDLDWGALWSLLQRVRDAGIRDLRGGIVVDRHLFDPARPDAGAPPFDESPEADYNVIPDALHLNGSLLEYTLSSTGDAVRASVEPAWPGVAVHVDDLHPGDLRCDDWEDGWRTPRVVASDAHVDIYLQGVFPRDCVQTTNMNLVERQYLTSVALRQLWAALGGRIDGPIGEGVTPASAHLVAHHDGRPLAEVLHGALKRSDNALTRLTFLRLGAAGATAIAPGNTQQSAASQVSLWLARHGVDANGLVLENGSGLSRAERISPQTLAAMLAISSRSLNAPELLSGLPVAGIDGTLKHRLNDGPAKAHARLKTGLLRDAVGVAGFVTDQRGHVWVGAAMVNDDKASETGQPVLDALIQWLAGRPSAARPARRR